MRNSLLVVAAVLVSTGAALAWFPAGVVAAGVLMGAFVLLSD